MMPRRRNHSALDERIIALATDFGQAVADVVRENIRAEVAKVIGAGRSVKPAVARVRRKRADGAAVQKSILSVLAGAKKGLQTGKLVQKTGLHRGAVEYHLRVLRRKKKARVVGTRGQARWFE